MAQEYLTPDQLCERLQHRVTIKTLANWRYQRRGPKYRRFGNRILYPISEIEAFERDHLFEGTSDYESKGRKQAMAKTGSAAPGTDDPSNYAFGHPTYVNTSSRKPDDWRFVDTNEPLWPDAYFQRECPACGMKPTAEGHDPCLGALPGVRNACCGHGVKPGYVMFEDGVVIRGQFDRVERPGSAVQISKPGRRD